MVYWGKGQVRIMKPLKNKVSITLDEEHIKKLAEEDDRSFSQYINMVLKEHIAKQNGDAERVKE